MKNLDSEFCGSLPLHNINLIQPHGALLVLRPDDLSIVQASGNTASVLTIEPAELIGKPLRHFLSTKAALDAERAAACAAGPLMPMRIRLQVPNGARELTGLFRPSQGCILLELEAYEESSSENGSSFGGLYGEMKGIMSAVSMTQTIEEACAAAVTELKRFSGFDQVMAYRFDADWNGTVAAEVREEDMPSYLNLRFPASDIPRQARALYSRNPYRLIASRAAAPESLTPIINPLTGGFTDLSDCSLRATTPVHIEYLGNMGVAASMSTRILVNGMLWGLVSCHHRTPKYPTYETCSVFELLVGVLAGKITALEAAEESAGRATLQRAEAAVLEKLYAVRNLQTALLEEDGTALKSLLGVTGVAIVEGKHIHLSGATPSAEAVREMVYWLQISGPSKTAHWERLSDVYEPAAAFTDTTSGLVCLPLRPAQGDYILGFRPEVLQTVAWGGDPSTAITFEADGKKYHPRASFRTWQQTLSGTALSWKSYELEAAERLRNYIQEFLLREVYI